MLGTKPFAGGLAALGVCLLVGCQTPRVDAPPIPEEGATLELSPEAAQFADVLANYAQGLIHDSNRNYDAALTNYLQAVELDASHEELSLRIAMGLLQQKRNDEAVRLLETLVDRRPESPKALAWLALVYRAAERPDDAIATYHSLIDLDPSAANAYLDFAGFYLRVPDSGQAIDILRTGIKKAREPFDLYRTLGRLLVEESNRITDEDSARTLRTEALDLYEKAIKKAPGNFEILVQLGELNIVNQEPEKAAKWFKRIEKLAPEDLPLRRQLALKFLQLGTTSGTIETLEKILEDQPGNAQIAYYLGELHQKSADIDAAIASFETACEASRKDPVPYIRLALMQIDQERSEQAAQTLLAGLEKMPDHGRLTQTLAYCYLDQNNAQEALVWFAKAEVRIAEQKAEQEDQEEGETAQDPDQRSRFYFNYARANYQVGNTEDAVKHLSRAMDEHIAYLQLFMRELLSIEGTETAEVIAFYESFEELVPGEPTTSFCLGMLHSFDEDFETALTHYERALDLAQTHHRNTQILNEDFYFSYAAAYERTGDIEKAEELFLQALELNPEHANAHNYLAYMWSEHNVHLDRAIEHINEAIQLVPDSGAFIDTLGWILYMQGNYEEALKEIEQANSLTPNDPTITDHLGDTLLKLDRTEEAIDQWKHAFRLDPDNEKIAAKLTDHGVDAEELRNELVAREDGEDTAVEKEAPAVQEPAEAGQP